MEERRVSLGEVFELERGSREEERGGQHLAPVPEQPRRSFSFPLPGAGGVAQRLRHEPWRLGEGD